MLVTLRLAYAIYRLRTMAASSSFSELPLVAVCQVTSTPDKEQNFKTCAELIREAARLGACLAFLPEAFDFIARDPEETRRLSEPLSGNLLEEYTQLARYQGRGGRGSFFLSNVLGLPDMRVELEKSCQCPLPLRECGLWLSLGGFHERGQDWEQTQKIYNCHVILNNMGETL